jgi:hypothetical protein
MKQESFYLVWNTIAGKPVVRHETLEKAREEARRLAQNNPCIEFFVLRAIEGITYREDPWRIRTFCKR